VPFVLTTYAIVVLWYLANGCVEDAHERARSRAPWYRHKTQPSFGDMLAALRRQLWPERIIGQTGIQPGSAKNHDTLSVTASELLTAA